MLLDVNGFFKSPTAYIEKREWWVTTMKESLNRRKWFFSHNALRLICKVKFSSYIYVLFLKKKSQNS